jgi:hypothetical protein
VQAAVRQEISGYWRRIARKRMLCLQDDWLDHGLIVLPRAAAVLTTGDLITKTEAISRLPDFGVPSTLAGEIRRRRDGQVAMLNADQKVRRALLARERRPAWPRIPGLPRSRTLRWISAPTPPRDLAEQCRDGGEDDG